MMFFWFFVGGDLVLVKFYCLNGLLIIVDVEDNDDGIYIVFFILVFKGDY